MFGQMAGLHFKTNERGETLFFFARFVPWNRKTYIVTDGDDAARLRRILRRYYFVLFGLVIPLMVLAFDNLFGITDISMWILGGLIIGAVCRLVLDLGPVHRIAGKYETSPERPGFGEAWRRQAEAYGWATLLFFASAMLLISACGVYLLYSGRTALGICGLAVGGSLFLHQVWLMALKRRLAREAPASP